MLFHVCCKTPRRDSFSFVPLPTFLWLVPVEDLVIPLYSTIPLFPIATSATAIPLGPSRGKTAVPNSHWENHRKQRSRRWCVWRTIRLDNLATIPEMGSMKKKEREFGGGFRFRPGNWKYWSSDFLIRFFCDFRNSTPIRRLCLSNLY